MKVELDEKKVKSALESYEKSKAFFKKINKESDFHEIDIVLTLEVYVHLVKHALSKGGSSTGYVRDFLLSLYSRHYKFDLINLRNLDEMNFTSCMMVLHLNQYHHYFENHKYLLDSEIYNQLIDDYNESMKNS